MRQSNRTRRFQTSQESTAQREALERRWRDRIEPEPRLATLVTSEGCAREPFHRWLPYRQGFSPGLVRLFLSENRVSAGRGPLLDPFSGAGTTITECARHRVAAVGIDAVPALAFLAAAKFARQWTPVPPIEEDATWELIAPHLESPLHRSALMIAEARRRTGSGAVNRAAPSTAKSLQAIGEMMGQDLAHPLPTVNVSAAGDARSLEGMENESITGILTSPPYLARYDYEQTNDAIITLYQFWFGNPREAQKSQQIRAASTGQSSAGRLTHAAVAEAYDVLDRAGFLRQAQTLRAYFADMVSFLQNARRVLQPDSPAWLVIGGARIKDVHVPSDLIIAELAADAGFEVEGMRMARELIPSRRKLGTSGHFAPRESLLLLTKR